MDLVLEYIIAHAKEAISLAAPFVLAYSNRKLKPKAKLIFANRHGFVHLVQKPLLDKEQKVISPTQTVNTNSITVTNVGAEPATKIEIVLNWKPESTNVWLSRHFEEKVESDGRNILIFESLAPQESVNLELLSINRDLPAVITVRCNECVPENILMSLQPVYSRITTLLGQFLVFSGIGAVLYIIISIIQFFSRIAP